MQLDRTQPARISHATAVATIASVALVWGLGFPMMRIALNGGLTVSALTSVRFMLAGLGMAAIVLAKRIPIVRRGLIDGLWLGIVLAVIFWLQADGLRITTTAKSGFITGLYVLFTPLVAVVIGQKVKPSAGLAALIATIGLYLLVHMPGGFWSGWNRGDVETLLCAMLCGVHIVMMDRFTRRSNSWLLASTQVITVGIISLMIALLLPPPYGLQSVVHVMSQGWVLIAMLYMALFCTVFAFWGQAVAQTRLAPTESAVLFCIEPVSAAVLSVVWLKEPMSLRQALGGALIVAAMIFSQALPYMWRTSSVPDTRP
jgi:drug/metabolite transporter (DMT)-like permease